MCGHQPLLVHWLVGDDAEALSRHVLLAGPWQRQTCQEHDYAQRLCEAKLFTFCASEAMLLGAEALSYLVDGQVGAREGRV